MSKQKPNFEGWIKEYGLKLYIIALFLILFIIFLKAQGWVSW